jgi:tetratricopeptide (TPR) repeat protein
MCEEQSGDFKGAEATVADAYFLAESAGRDDLRVDAATSIASIVGIRLARAPEGLAWLRHARAISERRAPEPDLQIRLRSAESGLLRAQQQFEPAGLAIAEAVAIAERHHAPDDPRLAAVVLNLGVNSFDRGDYPAAERLYDRALAILEKALGPHHPDLAPTLNNLGSVREKQGRFADAVAAMERAMAIREASVGPRHPGVAVSLTNLGVLAVRQRQYTIAEPHFRRALEIFEAALGKDHPNVASALGGLGRALVGQRRLAEARPLHLRAREILEKALGADHPIVAFALLDAGELELADDHPALAVPLATRALELSRAGKPEEQAAAQFLLARALHAAHQDQGRATTLAAAAELAWRSAGPGFQPELDEVITWRRTLPQ